MSRLDQPNGEPPADFKKARRRKAALVDPANLDRLPPHSVEAEQGVLGCVLLSPNDCLSHCVDKFKAGAEVFYDLRHRQTYEGLLAMHESKTAIDMITLQQWLKDRQKLEAVGGLAYLASLPDAVPSAANLDYYIPIVLEKFAVRRLVAACTEIVGRAYEHQGDIDQLLDEVERDITRISRERFSAPPKSNRDVLREIVDEWEAAANGTMPPGLRIGLADFDHLTGGLKAAQLVIIAARPSRGKSSLALGIADHVAVTLGQPVLFFSLEMGAKEHLERAACARARVDANRLRNGGANDREMRSVAVATSQIAKAPLTIIDTGQPKLSQLVSRARQVVQQEGTRLVVVDHLGLIDASDRGRSRYEEVTKVSGALKAMAMDLKVPVIALCQLNRDSEREERAPRLSDLRDSGSIEQDADIVCLLHPNADDVGDHQRCKLIVAKHRGATTESIDLVFNKPWTRFDSACDPCHEDT